MCEAKEELTQLVRHHRETLDALNDMGMEAITNIEAKGNSVFDRIEKKTGKMFDYIRIFAIFSLMIFGTPIGFLFLQMSEKADAQDVMFKDKSLYLHNEEAEVYEEYINGAADGQRVDPVKFENDMVKKRNLIFNSRHRGATKNAKGTSK